LWSCLTTMKGIITSTVPRCLLTASRERPHRPLYRFQTKSTPPQWRSLTQAEFAALVNRTAKCLIKLGLQKQENTSIVSSTRFEWVLYAMSAQTAAAVPVGIYHTCSAKEVAYIINHSESKILCIEDKVQYDKLKAEHGNLSNVRHIILLDGAVPEDPRVIPWNAFLKIADGDDDRVLNQRIAELKPEDLATLIYTSGTTGPPKGVMLTHANVTWTASTSQQALISTVEGDRSVSYLPLSHIAEQMFTIYSPLFGSSLITFAESIDKLLETAKEVEPTIFFAPPRVWEKFHASLFAKVPKGVPAAKLPPHVKQAMLAAVGMHKVRFAITGAAPISADILHFFHDLGLTIFEVYGQSEDNGPTSLNVPTKYRFGSVGPPIPGVEVKIADDGEILVRGPNVFAGYFKDPQATAETLRDGYLCSGDLGKFDDDGFLYVTGRKKDIIITAGGKNITPQNIENAIKAHPWIADAVVVGDRRPFLVALITLDVDVAAQIAKAKGISPSQLAHSSEVVAAIRAHIETVNKDLAQVETVKKFKILPEPFSLEKGEVTPTMKIKRNVVNKAYAAEIEKLYVGQAAL
jgi:long-chain acyl-CoA synthetase